MFPPFQGEAQPEVRRETSLTTCVDQRGRKPSDPTQRRAVTGLAPGALIQARPSCEWGTRYFIWNGPGLSIGASKRDAGVAWWYLVRNDRCSQTHLWAPPIRPT